MALAVTGRQIGEQGLVKGRGGRERQRLIDQLEQQFQAVNTGKLLRVELLCFWAERQQYALPDGAVAHPWPQPLAHLLTALATSDTAAPFTGMAWYWSTPLAAPVPTQSSF